MKKLLLALVLMVPMMVGCRQKQATTPHPKGAELDSIRHEHVNDSISELDTIRLLKTLFMGMTPSQFDTLVRQASNNIKIGNITFDSFDTLMYHGSVHNITLKGSSHQYNVSDIDEMARCVRQGESSYSDVVNALSSKYGSPKWRTIMSEMNDNGFQIGIANWDFDSFSIEYQQKQWARLQNMTFDIEAKISYSIPRIATPEEKLQTDSIVNAWEQKRKAEEQRNDEVIQSL